MNLFGAVADLQNGSIDCVQCGASGHGMGASFLGDYMLVVTGQFGFRNVKRPFTQSFLLSEITDTQQRVADDGVKRAVFYVRSEVLTLSGDNPLEGVSPREEAPIARKESVPAEETIEHRPRREAPTPRHDAMNEEKPKSAGKPSYEMWVIFIAFEVAYL